MKKIKPIKHNTYELSKWRVEPSNSYWATIFVAGGLEASTKVCQDFCMKVGLCVTIEPTNYVYTGGSEIGVRVGLIHYAPFPDSKDNIFNKARELGKLLAEENSQWSYTVLTPEVSAFFSRRRRKGETS